MQRVVAVALIWVWALGCAPASSGEQEWKSRTLGSSLSTSALQARTSILIDRLATHGIYNAQLFAGIAMAETGMAHCWSEATWACQGPRAVECDGPVIAGSGDRACSRRQGGLGMFQFDAGTHDQTLAREGNGILTVAGSVDAAVQFIIPMVIEARWIEGVDDHESAVRWINNVVIGSDAYGHWLTTVVSSYNGCRLGVCRAFNTKYDYYDDSTRQIANRFDSLFWRGRGTAGDTPTPTPEPRPEPTPEPAPEPAGRPGCEHTCPHVNDGECDDGGPRSDHAICRLGTDCGDCGPRTPEGTERDPAPAPTPSHDGSPDSCDPAGFEGCIPGNCCAGASCRDTASRGVVCCLEANQACEWGADCCGYMDCRNGRCEPRPTGRGCLGPGDCSSAICPSGQCG